MGDQPLWGLTSFHRAAPTGQIIVEGLTPRIRGQAASRLDLSMDQPQVGIRLTAEPWPGDPPSMCNSALRSTGLAVDRTGWPPVNVQPVPPWESLQLPEFPLLC